MSLLKEIRKVNLQIETNTSVYNTLDETNDRYYTHMQGEEESNDKNLQNLTSIIEAVEHLGVTIFADNALINCEKMEDDNKGDQRKSDNEYKKYVRGKTMGL